MASLSLLLLVTLVLVGAARAQPVEGHDLPVVGVDLDQLTTSTSHILDPDVTAPALVDLAITNKLLHPDDVLNVTIAAATLGTTRWVLIPPSKTRTIAVDTLSPVQVRILFRVRSVEYSPDTADMLVGWVRRAVGGSGQHRIEVRSPCKKGHEAYLQTLHLTFFVDVRALPGKPVQYSTGCALPVRQS